MRGAQSFLPGGVACLIACGGGGGAVKEPVAGLGDEAVLFKSPDGLRYLVVIESTVVAS